MSEAVINPKTSMLIDVQYVRAKKDKGLPDCVYTVWKDIETGEKFVKRDDEPKMPIYFEKDTVMDHKYPIDFQHIEKCDKKVVKYRDIPFEIAKHMGESGERFVRNCIDTRSYKNLRMLYTYPYVFGSDYDVRTFYRYEWLRQMGDSVEAKIRKGYMDIECDSFGKIGFPDPQTCPIDLVTVIDGENKVCYTFALVGREYEDNNVSNRAIEHIEDPAMKQRYLDRKKYEQDMYASRLQQEQELINDLDGLNKELHEMFDESYGVFDFKQYFYHDERQMLIHLFQCIHSISPDFLMIWNISFDIPYILNRMQALGLNPEEIICDKEFTNRDCYFRKDRHHFNVKDKADTFVCSSKTVYVDQMELYAATRKGREELRSFSLNFIGERELEDKKLDYTDEGGLKTLAYLNYRKYFIYNIKDVLLQFGIERNVEDVDGLFQSAYDNLTSYPDCFKQTVVLRNVQYRIYQSIDLIPGNNVNQIYVQKDMEEHPEKYNKRGKEIGFEGALVGNTKIINPFGKPMYGKRTNYLFQYSVDFDMTAFYPSTINTLNISAPTMIFKCIVNATEFTPRGGKYPYRGFTDVQIVKDNVDSFVGDISAEIFDNFQTGNILSTGYKFMNLPSITEIERMLKKKLAA